MTTIPAAARAALLVVATLAGCAPAQAGSDQVVAMSEHNVLTYRSIRCHPRFRAAAEAENCQRAEQSALQNWIYDKAILCAARMSGLAITPDESRSVEERVAAEHSVRERIASRHRALLRGVLRVQEGETLDAVMTDLSKIGIQSIDVEERLAHYDTAEETRRALATDHAASMEAAARAGMRRDLLFTKLDAFVRDRAQATGRTKEDEERILWSAAVQHCRIRVTDDRYKLPDFIGVFKQNVKQSKVR